MQAAVQRSELRRSVNAAYRVYRCTEAAKVRAIRDGRDQDAKRLEVLAYARLLAYRLLLHKLEVEEAKAKA